MLESLAKPTTAASLARPKVERGLLWRHLGALVPGVALLLSIGLAATMLGRLAHAPAAQTRLAGFSTSLQGRNRNQRHNAWLAARSIHGRVVPPGGVFSFNQTVQSWSVDQGYVKALVSYDGELVQAYGGGVCQTSTTLYNAALLAGLPILERHPHVFVPGYIVPGRDAAVAYPGIDLRFRNSTAHPIRIEAGVQGDRLEVSLLGAAKTSPPARVTTELLSVTAPQRLTRTMVRPRGARWLRRSFVHSVGTKGYRVVTSRAIGSRRREVLSDDTYPAMNRIIALSRDEIP